MKPSEREKIEQAVESLRLAYQPENGPYGRNEVHMDFDYLWMEWTDKNSERREGALELLEAEETDPKRLAAESERIRRYYRFRADTITQTVETVRSEVFEANGLPLDLVDLRTAADHVSDRARSTARSGKRAEFLHRPSSAPSKSNEPEGPSLAI